MSEAVRLEQIWDATDELLDLIHEYENERKPERIPSKIVAYEAAIYVMKQGCDSREDLFNTLGSLTAYFGENMDEREDDKKKFRPEDGLKFENGENTQ